MTEMGCFLSTGLWHLQPGVLGITVVGRADVARHWHPDHCQQAVADDARPRFVWHDPHAIGCLAPLPSAAQ